jgi:enoyl-CoA hydratase/carnithine racemase
MGGRIETRIEGDVGWLVFDHEVRRNALTHAMWEAIPDAVASFEAEPGVRIVIMRGAGQRAFVAGADISEFAEQRVGDAALAYDAVNALAFEALQSLSKPLVAMIHGFCVGGGCALALCADIRVAADDAVFAIPASRLGLGYSAAGLATLVRVVGDAAARDLFLTARRVKAAEAYHIGLVQSVHPKAELEAAVADLASGIASNAPLTLAAAKRVFRDLSLPDAERDPNAIADAIRACYASDDYREGVAAFLEKRAPRFGGH